MQSEERARQFMPFSALKGFEEMIREKEKVITRRREMLSDSFEQLSFKFSQIKKGDIVCVTYYDGENYIKLEGMVSKIDLEGRKIAIVKKEISFDDIFDVDAPFIRDIDEV